MPLLELLLLAAIWGASFLFLRLAAPQFGPVPLIALRVGIAALVLLPVLRSARARAQVRGAWRPLAVVGLSNSALPFTLFAVGALHLGSGFEAILNATTPLWTALIGAAVFGVAIGRAQLLGLFVGLLGVVVLVGEQPGMRAGGAPLAVAAALAAPVSYGFAAHYARRHLAGVDPVATAFGSQMLAALMLALPAAASWPARPVGGGIWLSVVALGVLCTGVAYVLYFRLIARVGAAYAASVTFLIPVFGVLWGGLFLHEALTVPMAAGCGIILLGTALASGQLQRVLQRRAATMRQAEPRP